MNWLAIIIIIIVTIVVIVFLTIAIIQINEYYNWLQIEYGSCKELKKKVDELQIELYRVYLLEERVKKIEEKIL